MVDVNDNGQTPDETRKAWEAPELKAQGNVVDTLRMGEGKVTTPTGDPGEPRKVPVQG
jgi:hypothetical protein